MLARRIAATSTTAVLAAPAVAQAAQAGGAGPSATPLLVELAAAGAIAAGMLARRPVARLVRAGVKWAGSSRARRRLRAHPRTP